MLQLQYLQTYGKRLLKAKERKRNQKVLQVQQSGISYKELQVRIKDKEQKHTREIRQRKQQREEFCQRFKVGIIQ